MIWARSLAVVVVAALLLALPPSHALAVTYTVDTTSDDNLTGCNFALDNDCSLRGAINNANANPGADGIVFDLGTGIPSISVGGTGLGALPGINETLTINGKTGGANLVELNGSAVTGDGLRILSGASGVTIQSLVINRFSGDGIEILASAGNNNVIKGNLIGTNASGTSSTGFGNGFDGIRILGGTGHTIGGASLGEGNIISGNGDAGIGIFTNGNTVQGNYIGVDANGTADLGNNVGIRLAADSNMIGGTTSLARNVISGNHDGIALYNGASENSVFGNFIGTNASGTSDVGNDAAGINLSHYFTASGPTTNFIGGTGAGERNVISGNGLVNVFIADSTTVNNTISGNIIGPDVNGSGAAMTNGVGIQVTAGADSNIIGPGNTISDNTNGVQINDAATGGIVVKGNKIGTNLLGSGAVPNSQNGVLISEAADNIIGGSNPSPTMGCFGDCNVISANGIDGIQITGASATANVVTGNTIGTNQSGFTALANSRDGVNIDGAGSNTVGGTTPETRNVISGNLWRGVVVTNGSMNQVGGNYIGLNAAGGAIVGNGISGVDLLQAVDTCIGGRITGSACLPVAGSGNVISGNNNDGVRILSSSTRTTLISNFIGINAAGTAAMPNAGAGVSIQTDSNTIGGDSAQARNVISGNGGAGVLIWFDADLNLIEGNFIGTNPAGGDGIANGSDGVQLLEVNPSEAPNDNIIGGTAVGEGNVISGNSGFGVALTGDGTSSNRVEGNRIGTDASGTLALGNTFHGVLIEDALLNTIGGTTGTTPGGPCTGACNVVSGNNGSGVVIVGAANSNMVQGNYIGTDATGNASLANLFGIVVSGFSTPSEPQSNVIGGLSPAARNVISGNSLAAVVIDTADGTLLQGNFIGLNAAGNTDLGNGGAGVSIRSDAPFSDATNNTIGGSVPAASNLIAASAGPGIQIFFASSNSVLGNHIRLSAGAGIEISGNNNCIGGEIISGDCSPSGNSANGVFLSTGDGISVVAGSGNSIRRNTIQSSIGLGIELGPDGVTPNDLVPPCASAPDCDAGANNLQNFPVLTSITVGGGNTTIRGVLNSTPGQIFTVEFFLSSLCDSSGYGEASQFIGQELVQADPGTGTATINEIFPLEVRPGQFVTATATRTLPPLDTSEFSACRTVHGPGIDSDEDGVRDTDELFCGGDEFSPAFRPELLDGAFAGKDDDGDTAIDEPLPPGSDSYDCDGDGWTGAQETAIYSLVGTAKNQDPCGANGWPAELAGNDNRLNIGDLNSFLFPLGPDNGFGIFAYFGYPVPHAGRENEERWNLLVDGTINIGDLNALNPAVIAPTSRPPMFGGLPAFFTDVGNGVGGCPYSP